MPNRALSSQDISISYELLSPKCAWRFLWNFKEKIHFQSGSMDVCALLVISIETISSISGMRQWKLFQMSSLVTLFIVLLRILLFGSDTETDIINIYLVNFVVYRSFAIFCGIRLYNIPIFKSSNPTGTLILNQSCLWRCCVQKNVSATKNRSSINIQQTCILIYRRYLFLFTQIRSVYNSNYGNFRLYIFTV